MAASPSHGGHRHIRGPGLQQGQRTGRRRRPGGDDIIHQQHALAGQIRARVADKRAPGILQALVPGQLLLRAGAGADRKRRFHRDPQHLP